jgi:two-component system, LuxR family, sensor kinase FixL
MAHEGRNLLQSASACLERLTWRLEGQPEALDLVRRARQAQRGLALLFEDVRLYAAPLRVDLAACPLPPLWREVWDEVRESFPGREAHLAEEVTAADPACWADCFRLGQVFRNILENSFAACDGPVRMDIACADERRDGRPGLRLSLRDHGPGLNDEQRQRLFEPFYTTKPSGTGLGMTIAKRIIEAHGGQITTGDTTPGLEILLWLPRDAT